MTTGGDDDEVAVRERFTADEVVGPAVMEDEEDAAEDSTTAVAVELRSAAERESAGFCTAMI